MPLGTSSAPKRARMRPPIRVVAVDRGLHQGADDQAARRAPGNAPAVGAPRNRTSTSLVAPSPSRAMLLARKIETSAQGLPEKLEIPHRL